MAITVRIQKFEKDWNKEPRPIIVDFQGDTAKQVMAHIKTEREHNDLSVYTPIEIIDIFDDHKETETPHKMLKTNETERSDDTWGLMMGEDPKKLKGRPINEELIDVWATMLSEKIEKLKKRQTEALCQETLDMDKYRHLEAYINGFTEAWALLSCLEKGRFKKDYDRIVEETRMVKSVT